MSVEILYDFKYTNGSIFEVKFNDLSENAEKKDRFQWYLIDQNKRYDLKFQKMVHGIRYFTSDYCDCIVLDVDKKTILMGYDLFDLN